MIPVFFIYGLTFFTLGLAIIIYPKKDSEFKLANNLLLIAGFGIIHGINEWVDMFKLINKDPGLANFLHLLGLPMLVVSFLFLVQFGVVTIIEKKKQFAGLKFLPVCLFTIWLVISILNKQHFLLIGGIWGRYLFGVPGIVLTAYGLFLKIPELEKKHLKKIGKHLRLAALGFLCYAFFSGIITPKADFFPASFLNYETFFKITGIPVQVFRTVCAAVISYALVIVLGLFEWETKTRIKNTKEFLDNILKNMQDGLMIVNPDYSVAFMNQSFSNIFGKDVVGKKCYEVCEEDNSHELCPYKGPIKVGETDIIELSYKTTDKVFMVARTGMKNTNGSLALLHIFRDITKLKKLEQLKNSLTHMIVHDLNNPLMVLGINLELLQMDAGEQLSNSAAKGLDISLYQIKNMKNMISNILDISKMEEHKLNLRRER